MKTLILGIGNPILTDDAVGIKIARAIKEDKPSLDVIETSEVGLALLELVDGYDRVVIIDSIKSDEPPGELRRLGLEDLEANREFTSSHGIDIATAIEIGRRAGYKMPSEINLYAVAIKDNATFSEECTPEIRRQIPHLARRIAREEKL